jgi:colicin import membrane protein
VGVTILTSSGDTAFDRSVEQAALKVEQFVELQGMEPDLFERKFRQVDVAFSPEDLRL